jgi:hypothetical protein
LKQLETVGCGRGRVGANWFSREAWGKLLDCKMVM